MRSNRRLLGPAATAAVALSILGAGCSSTVTTTTPAGSPGSMPGASVHPNGPFPGLRYRNGGTATLNSVPAPASWALPGANDLLAVDLARTASTTAIQKDATVLAAADSGIWRSVDGGVSWRRELAGIQAWSLAAMPEGGYAALGDLPQPSAARGSGAPVLATSANGISWRIEPIAVPGSLWPSGYGYRFALSGLGPHARGVAVPDNGEFGGPATSGGPAAYRTSDGGRSWQRLSLPGAFSGLTMLPGGRIVYATGSGTGAGCAGAVYESADDGAAWRLLPGSCQPCPLLAVQFITAKIGFAAGGVPVKFGGAQLVEATDNGGRTWQVRWRSPVENGTGADGAVLRLDMLTGSQGWAVTGGCVVGQNGPCPGNVYVTSDGGRRWHRTGQRAITIAALGPDRALAANDVAQTAAATTDGGRTWALQTQPDAIATSAFDGVGGTQFWATTLGDFVSADAGRRWTAAGQLASPRFSHLAWQAAPPGQLLGYEQNGGGIWVSGDAGRTWTAATVPGVTATDVPLSVALGSGRAAAAVVGQGYDCVSDTAIEKLQAVKPGWKPPAGASVLYLSASGGTGWNQVGRVLPFGVPANAAVAVSGTRIAVIDACDHLQRSADDGAHWTAQALGDAMFCTISQLSTDLWLACTDVTANSTDSWALYSADGGSTWLLHRLPAAANACAGIFAVAGDAAVMPIGGAIWRTADGGKIWKQTWPALTR
jgi:hypothetical protein